MNKSELPYRDMLEEGKAIPVNDYTCKNCYLFEHGDKAGPLGYKCKGGPDGPFNPVTGKPRKAADAACMWINRFFIKGAE